MHVFKQSPRNNTAKAYIVTSWIELTAQTASVSTNTMLMPSKDKQMFWWICRSYCIEISPPANKPTRSYHVYVTRPVHMIGDSFAYDKSIFFHLKS